MSNYKKSPKQKIHDYSSNVQRLRTWAYRDQYKSTNDPAAFSDITSTSNPKNVYYALRPIVFVGTLLGFMPLSNTHSTDLTKLKFQWLSLKIAVTTILLAATVSSAGLSIYHYANTYSTDDWDIESVVVRPRETMYYLSASLFLIILVNVSRHLPTTLLEWDETAARLVKYLDLSPVPLNTDLHLKVSNAVILAVFFMTLSLTEHILHDINVSGLMCGNFTIFTECYYKKANDYYAIIMPYSPQLSIAVLIFNKVTNLVWNYPDLLVALVSQALKKNFQVITRYLEHNTKYNKRIHDKELSLLRQDHLALCDIVKNFDDIISPAILLSYATNIYYICVQVFHAIR